MKNQAQRPQTACICIHLRRIAQKVTDLYDKALQPAGVSVNQYSLLANISRMEGCGTGDLAQKVGLEKSTLVRTLAPLLRAGLIMDQAPQGSRRRSLHLTPAGRETLHTALPLWTKVQADVAGKLGKNQAELMDLFARIALW